MWMTEHPSLPRSCLERSRTAFLCLPLRAGVLTVGLLGSTLALSGLVAYAIVQVPTIRRHVADYNIFDLANNSSSLMDRADGPTFLGDIAYGSEMIGAVVSCLLALLVNLMLVFSVIRSRRWFLVHWLVLHVFFIILLFIASILLFVIQLKLWKLLGIIPVAVSLLIMYCWTKVWELFTVLGEECQQLLCHQDYLEHMAANLQYQMEVSQKPNYTKTWLEGLEKDWSHDYQFYPGDPLSRGMAKRLEGVMRDSEGPWRESWQSMGMGGLRGLQLPYDEMEDLKIRGSRDWRESSRESGPSQGHYEKSHEYEKSHTYEGESSDSSIVPSSHHIGLEDDQEENNRTATLRAQDKIKHKTSIESKTDSNVSAVLI